MKNKSIKAINKNENIHIISQEDLAKVNGGRRFGKAAGWAYTIIGELGDFSNGFKAGMKR